MAKFYTQLDDKLIEFVKQQKMYFVATADKDGRINVSPKGMDSLRVLGPKRVAWLNLTGSGNETAAHLREVNRMTIMFCAFEGRTKILRLYGQAKTLHVGDKAWETMAVHFPHYPSARQIYDMQIESLQTSCGFGVPLFEYQGNRELLNEWAQKRGEDGIKDYWTSRNAISIDGRKTGTGKPDTD